MALISEVEEHAGEANPQGAGPPPPTVSPGDGKGTPVAQGGEIAPEAASPDQGDNPSQSLEGVTESAVAEGDGAKAPQFDEGMPAQDVEHGEDVGQGVKKLVLEPGKEGSATPVPGATVFAHYKAWVRSTGSKVFDTWEERAQLEMTLGNVRRDLTGLSLGVQSMRQGERALLLVPYSLAYGEQGNFSFPSVPPRADLLYEVQLNGFDNPAEGRKRANLTADDRIESADRRRQAGNEHFKENRFEEALSEYEMALGYMGEEFMMQMFGKYKDMADAVRLPCLLNSAACHLRLGRFHDAIGACSAVLVEDKGNVKALFRRGRAKMGLGHMEDAAEDLKQAQKLAPGDAAITKALAEIAKEEMERRAEEKRMFKGVLKKREESKPLLKGSSSNRQPSSKNLPWWQAVWRWLKSCVWHFFDWLGRRKRD